MSNDQATPRCRAKRACRRCNGRRVKCNVMEKHPCDNCAQVNTSCEVPESRRGRRPRASERGRASAPVQQMSLTVPADDKCHHQNPDHEDQRETASLEPTGPKSRDQHAPSLSSSQTSVCAPSIEVATGTLTHTNTELNFAMSQLSRATDDDTELFLGESATVRCVYDDETNLAKHPSPQDNARLRFSFSLPVDSEAAFPEWEAERKERRMRYLRDDGVFDMPPDAVSSVLLEEYFRWFHPCFPVIDRAETMRQWEAKTLSPLLTQAIFSVAAVHVEEKVFADAGFPGRQRARYMFYSKAKDLYESDHEKNQTTVIQAVFLMTFWRSGQILDKHTRHWLGIAITLAQSKAMHRCFPTSDDSSQARRLRKRIWWSIYIRECQCSASLGLPIRIRDCDCDVEPLELADVNDAPSPGQQGPPESLMAQSSAQVAYVVEMAKLALLLRRIVDLEYIPSRTLDMNTRHNLKEKLSEWEDQLPKCLTLHSRLGESLDFYAAMLHLAYNNLLILLFRNVYIHKLAVTDCSQGQMAVQAAARNSFIIEDILARGLMQHADIHLINSLFNSLCIHVVHIRRSEGTVRSVTEHRARLCLLGLHELQKMWQVTIWLLQLRLFFQALDKATTERLGVVNGDSNSDFGFPDTAVNMATDVLPPATSIIPEVWGPDPFQIAQGEQPLLPDFHQMLAHGEFSEIFGWNTGAAQL